MSGETVSFLIMLGPICRILLANATKLSVTHFNAILLFHPLLVSKHDVTLEGVVAQLTVITTSNTDGARRTVLADILVTVNIRQYFIFLKLLIN